MSGSAHVSEPARAAQRHHRRRRRRRRPPPTHRPGLAHRHDGRAPAGRARSAPSTCAAAGRAPARPTSCTRSTWSARVDAICLSGGSAYGLDAAGGVMAWLEAQDRGFRHRHPRRATSCRSSPPPWCSTSVPAARSPTVPTPRSAHEPPNAASTRRRPPGHGRRRHRRPRRGAEGRDRLGQRRARRRHHRGRPRRLNSGGNAVDPGPASCGPPGTGCRASSPRSGARRGAICGVQRAAVATPTRAADQHDARRRRDRRRAGQGRVLRVAGAGHDGMARAINPIHTYTDGDVVFAMGTHEAPVPEAPSDGFIQPDGGPLHPARPGDQPRPPTASPGPSSTPS